MGYSAKFATIVCIAFFAWTAVTLIFGFAGLREGGVLCQATPTGRVYRAHPYGRISAVMLGLLFVVGTPLVYGSIALESSRRDAPIPSWGWLPFALIIAMSTPMGVLMFWLAGPNEFFLDFDRRTYRHIYGAWFHQKVKAGSMDDDLEGVYLRCVSMNSRYEIGLAWKRERYWKLLGAFNRSGRADAFAEETAAVLVLPLVAPPSYLKSSKDIRNGLG